ncbi:hypothetical protein M3Y99_01098400 [Aphelenchoides fujianensis]|nr:hypothetical protein M3Y99_01098400 [Aphelenchoides fujianensis]
MADPSNKYAPLTPALVRALTDKVYEKRKASALEIEKSVKDLIKHNRMPELEKLIAVVEELTATPNGNVRKGGLMGLAAVAIGLGKNYTNYSDRLLLSALTCFNDADSRVRYFACESLYNVVKICRSSALNHFEELFDALWKLSSDTEQTVRSGAELLDRLEIVRSTPDFDVNELMLLIRERIYTSNSSNRRFIISWLHAVLKMPGFSVKAFIPEVVDGLLKVLDDPSPAVHDTTITVLSELLHCLDVEEGGEQVSPGSIVNILVSHTSGSSASAREIALIWLSQLCVYYKKDVLEFLSGMLSAALPWLHAEKLKAAELNKRLIDLVDSEAKINVDSVVECLLAHMRHEQTDTRMAALNWVRRLHSNLPAAIFPFLGKFFPEIVQLLEDPSDDVLMLDIMLLSEHHQHTDPARGHRPPLRSIWTRRCFRELDGMSPYLIKFTITEESRRERSGRACSSACTNAGAPNRSACSPCAFCRQNYEHAVDLSSRFSSLDLTTDILIELDRLIQLIESPILAYVRMDLLSAEHQRPLASVLSALLMLLPQTEAFNTLHKRLQVIPHLQVIDNPNKQPKTSTLDFKKLLAHFDAVAESRKAGVRDKHLRHLQSLTL